MLSERGTKYQNVFLKIIIKLSCYQKLKIATFLNDMKVFHNLQQKLDKNCEEETLSNKYFFEILEDSCSELPLPLQNICDSQNHFVLRRK